MSFLTLWNLLLSNNNLYDREFLNPSLLPPLLRENFGHAMLVQVDDIYRRKLIMSRLRKFLWSRFLQRKLNFSPLYIRYLRSRVSILETLNSKFSISPLSMAFFPNDYRDRCCQAIRQGPQGLRVLNSFCQFRNTGDYDWSGELDTVEHQANNGRFDAILQGGRVWMGTNHDLKLKVCVVNCTIIGNNVTTFIFHPTTNTLICGREDGTVDFFDFIYHSGSLVPSFEMKLVASLPCNPIRPSPVRFISVSPKGNLIWVEYTQTQSLLFSKDEKTSFTMHPIFNPESPLFQENGGMSALTFFQGNMILVSHLKTLVVLSFDESNGSLTMVAKMPHIFDSTGLKPDCVMQIISCGDLVFVLRTRETIFLIQIEPDFTRYNVVFEQPVYGRYSSSKPMDYLNDSITLSNNILILVIPSQEIVKFFLIKDNQMTLVLRKSIETPTCWSFNPITSVFSYFCVMYHSTRQFGLRV